jgi:hypothetical protein
MVRMVPPVEGHINLLRRGYDYKTIRELVFKHLCDLIISGKFETGQ